MAQNHDDFLEQLEQYTRAAPDIAKVLHSSLEVFRHLEPWLAARSDHPRVQQMLPAIRSHVRRHCRTLNTSVKVAEGGFSTADNAVALFDELTDHETSTENLLNFISLISEESNQLGNSVTSVVSSLRSDRMELLAVKTRLAETQSSIEEERNRVLQLISDKRSRAHRVISKMIKAVKRKMNGRPTSTSYILLSLPMFLPVNDLQINWDERQIRTERDYEPYSCEQAISRLEAGTVHIESLEQHLNSLTAYWTGLEMIMQLILHRLESLREDPTSRILFRGLHKKYERIRDDFLDYKIGIQQLQDYTQARLNRLSESSLDTPN